jgi:alkylation response protein AidB-like acyl-CoA dehydrogenase
MTTTNPTMIDEATSAPTPAEYGEEARHWLESRLGPGKTEVRTSVDITEVVTRDSEDAVLANAVRFQADLYEAGFAGITWPAAYGGRGLTLSHQVAFDEASADFWLPTSGVFTIGHGMCGPTILAHGTEKQRLRYLPPMLAGSELWCQLFSEPNAGSDLAALTTRATQRGDSWILDGQKLWTSGARYCDFGIVLARSDPQAPKHRGLSMFVLNLHASGVTVRPIRQLTGGARFNEIFLDAVEVKSQDLIGSVHEGWRVATTTLMNERVAIGTGARRHALVNPLIRLARQKGLSSDERIRDQLARMWIQEAILGYVGLRIRESILSGNEPGPEGSIAKLASARVTKESASLGVALLGAHAAAWQSTDNAALPAVNNLLLSTGASLAGGTDEIQKNLIAERVLGLPREPVGVVK